jgi:hypothetical protein
MEENLFFYIFGAQPNTQGKHDIAVKDEVLQGQEKVINFEPKTYDFPFVSLPMPMEQKIIIKQAGKEFTREKRDLKPEYYTLFIKISDNVSGKSVTKNIDFQAR